MFWEFCMWLSELIISRQTADLLWAKKVSIINVLSIPTSLKSRQWDRAHSLPDPCMHFLSQALITCSCIVAPIFLMVNVNHIIHSWAFKSWLYMKAYNYILIDSFRSVIVRWEKWMNLWMHLSIYPELNYFCVHCKHINQILKVHFPSRTSRRESRELLAEGNAENE